MTDSYIMDDGSLEAKVLQHEYKGTVIKVGEYNLNKWLSEVIEETDEIIRVYLPFCSSSLVRPDIDIRTDIAEAHHNYAFIRIILPYEQMDRPTIERKASEYGIKQMTDFKVYDHALTPEEVSKEYTDKIKEIDFKSERYGKYSVGGNDSLRSEPKGRKSKKRED